MLFIDGGAGDKEWLLLAARGVIEGKTLYVDIFEVNPPLVIWLYCLPVWLSLHFPVFADTQWLSILGLIAVTLVASVSRRLIRLHPAFAGQPQRQSRFCAAFLFCHALLFFTTQIYFVDRDDIFFILVFPYLLRFMPALAAQTLPKNLRCAVGLLAAVAFCIKPHTVIVFAVLQLLQWRRTGLKSLLCMENVIIAAGAALYALCVWSFAPDYVTTVFPMALATYGGFSRHINALLFCSLAFVSFGLTFADFRPCHATPFRRDAVYFVGVCAALLVYALAGNGWGYTYNPGCYACCCL